MMQVELSPKLSTFQWKMDKTTLNKPKYKYNFPFRFQIIFNSMFITLLSPFWVSLGEDQQVELKEFLPQKVLKKSHSLGFSLLN